MDLIEQGIDPLQSPVCGGWRFVYYFLSVVFIQIVYLLLACASFQKAVLNALAMWSLRVYLIGNSKSTKF